MTLRNSLPFQIGIVLLGMGLSLSISGLFAHGIEGLFAFFLGMAFLPGSLFIAFAVWDERQSEPKNEVKKDGKQE